MPLVGAAGIGSMLGSGIIMDCPLQLQCGSQDLDLPTGRSESSQEHLHLQLQQVHCSQEILQSYSD